MYRVHQWFFKHFFHEIQQFFQHIYLHPYLYISILHLSSLLSPILNQFTWNLVGIFLSPMKWPRGINMCHEIVMILFQLPTLAISSSHIEVNSSFSLIWNFINRPNKTMHDFSSSKQYTVWKPPLLIQTKNISCHYLHQLKICSLNNHILIYLSSEKTYNFFQI